MNILIDDSLKAVLCDLGLAQTRADVSTRTAIPDAQAIMGSRNWMAPERLMGERLRASSDIYSFAITMHEVGLTLCVDCSFSDQVLGSSILWRHRSSVSPQWISVSL
jgi:serine/threonine protein kinase